MTERQAYHVSEFCEAFHLCRATFYRLVQRGELRVHKVGRRTVVLQSDVTEWVLGLPKVTGKEAEHARAA